ncbi:MAG TPA: bifunctional glycosyltransferase family 2 protein/CDP-glycerol:glycerophosphate glycerophosphotransferase [Clostridiales bacterium]|nr:bifunctional glycosyltransferase family 2 protein/CDP-glycerol:glycerophosphate glycerophosphotransferase [Clostridiales bacterium]
MKVSVIIPYHMDEANLTDCLDSLIEEEHENKEIIIVCDSVENSELEFVDKYKQKLDIRVHKLENKTGVAAARNLGIDKATGDYIYFLDSDDYLYNNTIQTLVEGNIEESDIIYGKKKWTWFQRSVYIAMKQEEDNEDDEDEDINIDSAQLQAEGGAYEKKESDNDEEEEPEDSEELLKQETINRAYRLLITKRKGIKNISVLNILFKRSFIENNKLRFKEDFKYFSDLPFLVEALSKTEEITKCYGGVYIKRRHNDPINFPSLSQIKDPLRFDEQIEAYLYTINKVPADSEIRDRLDRKLIAYYTKTYAPRLRRSEQDKWRNENFIAISRAANEISPKLIKTLKGYRKKAMKALRKADLEKSIKIVNRNLAWKKFKRLLKSKPQRRKHLYIHSFLKKPVKENYILFESFFGKSYSDSPKYIYEYLSKNYPGKYKCIWVINKRNQKIPYKHTKIKRFSYKYYYYLARSKYFVFNGRQPEWVQKREGNVFLQTWHGTPLKKLVFDQDDVKSATPRYKMQVYKQSRLWDYLIAPNQFSHEVFRRCFMYDEKMLDTGYPRNDILHAENKDEIAKEIRKKLNIPLDKKTILYAPTWRDDEFYDKGQYKFELQLNLRKMKEELGDGYVILLRTHYFIADHLDVTGLEGFAYNLSKYNDIAELYLISDILITDYSSVFFDYANLKRPILFFTYDLEKYRDVLRGFYIDIETEVPGPLLFNTEEIISQLKNINEMNDKYKEIYESFYNRFCAWEDGNASGKVVKAVFKL